MEGMRILSRHLSVQTIFRFLNSGTLNRGRNLCVTVAIDYLTVDGFHDELQLSAKNTKGSLELLSLHFFWLIEIPTIREHSNTRITPRIRLVRGREVWKGTLMVADLEQVDTNTRVRFPQRKSQREGGDLDQSGDNSKNADGQWNLLDEISGSQNSNLDKVSSKFEEKFKKTLENWTGFLPPTNKARSHCTSTQAQYRDQWYPHQNCFEKYLGKTCHEFLQQADLRRLTQVKQVALMVQVYRRFLPCQELVYSFTSDIISAGCWRFDTRSSINRMWVRIDKHGETRCVIQPIVQCRCKRVSEQKLKVHDKYGETRYSAFFEFRKHDAGGCWQGLWTSFQCRIVQVHLTALGHSKSNVLSPSAEAESPRQPTVMQRKFDD